MDAVAGGHDVSAAGRGVQDALANRLAHLLDRSVRKQLPAIHVADQGHPVYYYENIEGGHSAAANNQQQAYGWALDFAFLWKMLGTSPSN